MIMPWFEVKRRFGGHGGAPCEWEFSTTDALEGFAQFAQLVSATGLASHVAYVMPARYGYFFALRQDTPRAVVERVIAELLCGAWE
jgi:hypothetical protein